MKCWVTPFDEVVGNCGETWRVTVDISDPTCTGNIPIDYQVFPDDTREAGTDTEWYKAGYCDYGQWDHATNGGTTLACGAGYSEDPNEFELDGSTPNPTYGQCVSDTDLAQFVTAAEFAEAVAAQAERAAAAAAAADEAAAVAAAAAALAAADALAAEAYTDNDYVAGQYIITGIRSAFNQGFIVSPLQWQTTEATTIPATDLDSYLDDGELAIYINQFVPGAWGALSMNREYFTISQDGEGTGLTLSFNESTSKITVEYSDEERDRLRDLFGHPNDTNVQSLIESAVSTIALRVAEFSQPNSRFKTNRVYTKPFIDDELTILTGEEETQGISLALTTTVTSVSETETQAESTSTYETGGRS